MADGFPSSDGLLSFLLGNLDQTERMSQFAHDQRGIGLERVFTFIKGGVDSSSINNAIFVQCGESSSLRRPESIDLSLISHQAHSSGE